MNFQARFLSYPVMSNYHHCYVCHIALSNCHVCHVFMSWGIVNLSGLIPTPILSNCHVYYVCHIAMSNSHICLVVISWENIMGDCRHVITNSYPDPV